MNNEYAHCEPFQGESVTMYKISIWPAVPDPLGICPANPDPIGICPANPDPLGIVGVLVVVAGNVGGHHVGRVNEEDEAGDDAEAPKGQTRVQAVQNLKMKGIVSGDWLPLPFTHTETKHFDPAALNTIK